MRLYSVKETSAILGVNVNKVYDLIKARQLRAMKLSSYKIPCQEIDRFIERNIGKDLSNLEVIKELYHEA